MESKLDGILNIVSLDYSPRNYYSDSFYNFLREIKCHIVEGDSITSIMTANKARIIITPINVFYFHVSSTSLLL